VLELMAVRGFCNAGVSRISPRGEEPPAANLRKTRNNYRKFIYCCLDRKSPNMIREVPSLLCGPAISFEQKLEYIINSILEIVELY